MKANFWAALGIWMGNMIRNDDIFKFKRRFELGNQVASLDVEMLACHIEVSKFVLQFLALKCVWIKMEREIGTEK